MISIFLDTCLSTALSRYQQRRTTQVCEGRSSSGFSKDPDLDTIGSEIRHANKAIISCQNISVLDSVVYLHHHPTHHVRNGHVKFGRGQTMSSQSQILSLLVSNTHFMPRQPIVPFENANWYLVNLGFSIHLSGLNENGSGKIFGSMCSKYNDCMIGVPLGIVCCPYCRSSSSATRGWRALTP